MKHHLLQEAHGWNIYLLLHCWRQFVLVTVFWGGRKDMDNHQLFDVISNWIRCSSVWGWGVPLIGKEITSAWFLLHVANLTLFSWNLPSAQKNSNCHYFLVIPQWMWVMQVDRITWFQYRYLIFPFLLCWCIYLTVNSNFLSFVEKSASPNRGGESVQTV